MADRQIFAMGGGGFSEGEPALDQYLLGLVASDRPRVCFIGTASGDSLGYRVKFRRAMERYGCEAGVLTLFPRKIDDLAGHLMGFDVVYVGGGSTVNLLAVWRLHGLDGALRHAWEEGVILAGISAGANCWFESFLTDSFGGADAYHGGLGFLEGSFCPHYDAEPERKPVFLDEIAAGAMPSGWGCDDDAAVHFVGTEPVRAVAGRKGAGVMRVMQTDDGVSEEPFPVELL
jgi:dipeptidase E